MALPRSAWEAGGGHAGIVKEGAVGPTAGHAPYAGSARRPTREPGELGDDCVSCGRQKAASGDLPGTRCA